MPTNAADPAWIDGSITFCMCLENGSSCVMVSNSPLASGTGALRSSFVEFFKGKPTLTFTPTKIDVVSPTVATDYGTYTLTADTPDGKITDRGNYTTIWHKVNGKWRIAVDAPVSTTPMAMPGAATAVAYAPDARFVAPTAGGKLRRHDEVHRRLRRRSELLQFAVLALAGRQGG